MEPSLRTALWMDRGEDCLSRIDEGVRGGGPPDLSNLGDIRPNPPPPISLDDGPAEPEDDHPLDDRL